MTDVTAIKSIIVVGWRWILKVNTAPKDKYSGPYLPEYGTTDTSYTMVFKYIR